MRKTSLTTMIAALVAILLDFALIVAAGNMTMTIDGAKPESLAGLARGNFLHLFGTAPVWSSLGSLPRPGSLVMIDAIVMMGVLIGAAFFVLRVKLRLPLIAVAWASTVVWIVPVGVSMFMLRGNQALEKVGGWLALELVSIFYAMMACFVFAGLQWAMSKKRAEKTIVETQPVTRPKVIEYPL